MSKGRLEAFSDAVLAVIITIMVLDIKAPDSNELKSLWHLWPKFLSYILSFTYIAIYWNNHHHMMHAVNRVSGSVLWTNVHLLFWLSLVPFATAWMSEHGSLWPVVVYGFVLLMAGIAYYFLAHCLANIHGKDSDFAQAIGDDWKGKVSVVIYVAAIALCFVDPAIGYVLYFLVAAMWFIPDKRFEKKMPG